MAVMPGKPTPAEIEEWKDAHGSIFSVGVGREEYIFRALTIREHEKVTKLANKSMSTAEELVISSALLYPKLDEEGIGNLQAGTVSALAEEILDYSGWTNPKYAKGILEQERSRMDELQFLVKAFILSALPSYTEEDLDQLTFHQIFHKVALAEKTISIQQETMGIEGSIKIDLIDPEEEAQKQEQEMRKAAATKKPGQAGPNDEIAQKLHQALG